ncbi:MAG TPA: Gfo/Idh/MocA family oxidoreductase [Verrucomicrobiae bacterium]|jgi:predicted dehydrogenase|nr:Gfo/Idh/MocA family oxidoreductase [Verrucomicrobiae bacterium]
MTQNDIEKSNPDFNRRHFIKGASVGSLMLAMGGVPLLAESNTNTADSGETHYNSEVPPVACAVIGCGVWGREVLQTLALLPKPDAKIFNAPVVAICDTYQAWLNRAKEFAPKAEAFTDYKKVLELKSVEAVIICTPSHLHREITIAALQAGKHVYCEAPLANSIEDARAIAQAAKTAVKCNFQAGLQMRSDPVKHDVLKFIRNGAIGKSLMARSQSHNKQSWRRTSPNPEREKALNWRLDKTTSLGLIGEIGIHQIDLMNWFINERPTAVTGFGAIMNWSDGRDVADTIQSLIQYPGKANFMYDATLANSFDGEYDMIYGTFAAVMMRYEAASSSANSKRESKAWMFKEVDAPLIGWEIYASKEQFRHESGLALAAGSTKSVKAGDNLQESPYAESTLHYALKAFVKNCHLVRTGLTDYAANFGDDPSGLADYITGLAKSRTAAATYQEGFEATVTAIITNKSIVEGKPLEFSKDMFEI